MKSEGVSHSGTDLKSLWDKVCSDNEEALKKLFLKTFDALYSYGYRIIPESESVRDAIQEVFFQIWKYRKKLTSPDSVKAYLFVSLRRELLSTKSSSHRRREVDGKYYSEEFEPLFDYDKWDEILGLKQDDSINLKEAIDQLSPRQKEIIYLKYYEGLSTPELSKILDIQSQSIYNLVFSAIENLRIYLDK